ncbi:hypothetical protein AOT82_2608 [Psychrobacter sp. AntiMn-1]|uniref:glycosyltransferase family 2 protein n=1 Tax=Psychrobacter sp. AntiMn-1 TaxID=1720344 RepID=UPI0008A7044D|nr:glycosyltransferase family 2 protein [Psychrobacter sp. AntiMn-1]AOY44987.1 hypothetical protein AOT82_2608 [Psychrobacter sp. AntiMn-1]
MNYKNSLISIIVPIYNAELYLSECLFSIASQTYQNIEVILINDGSTDTSKEIAEQVCEEDERFRLINQPNSGVAAARQLGLESVKGEYVIHCDSDDLMKQEAIEHLYKSIVDNNSNIAVGSYIKEFNSFESIITHSTLNKKEFIQNIFTGKYHASLWNKLISINLCRDIKFEENINYMEDFLFLMKVLSKKNVKISITDEIVYFYRQVETSYTNNITYDSITSSIKVIDKICDLYEYEYDNSFLAHIKNKSKIRVLLGSNITQRNIFPESTKYLIFDNAITSKHKVLVLSDILHMNYIIRLYKFLNYLKLKRVV